jgi:hypothetical protein
MKCADCHGDRGLGDGTSAATLKDDWGFQLRPNNFTRGIYKGGGTNKDIYLRFTTGMNGTPMPSYKSDLKEEERWALVHYVKSLAGSKVAIQTGQMKLLARRTDQELKLNPHDRVWDKIEPVQIPMMLIWQRQQATEAVSFKALHNGKNIAFLLEWEDKIVNSQFIRHHDFTDGAALQFYSGEKPPNFTMGQFDKPVNIWFWRMDRQMDIVSFKDVESVYKWMTADDYIFETMRYPKSMDKSLHMEIFPAPKHNRLYLSGWGAGNILSNPERGTAVENLLAHQFATLKPLPKDQQTVTGHGAWADGKWSVIFIRSMENKGAEEVQFRPGNFLHTALAAWDGAQEDRDGKKSVTCWQSLLIEK